MRPVTYTPADFGLEKNGPQFAWLDERLILHGYPPLRLLAWASLVFAAMQIGVTAFLVTYLAEDVGLGLVAAVIVWFVARR